MNNKVKVILGLVGVGAVIGGIGYSYKKHREKKERSYVVHEILVNPVDEYDDIFEDEDILAEEDEQDK